MGSPSLSVIMPMLWGARHLKEAFGSIFAQSFRDYELIVVDNCSRKEASACLDGVAGKHANITVIRDPNVRNLGNALFQACKFARGEYVTRHDPLDLAEPECFKNQINVMRSSSGIVAASSDYQVVDEFTAVVGERRRTCHSLYLLWELLFGDYLGIGANIVWRRSAMEKAGGYNPSLSWAADYDLLSSIASYGEISVVNKCLYSIRRSKECLNTQLHQERHEETVATVRSSLERLLSFKVDTEIARKINSFWCSNTANRDSFEPVRPLVLQIEDLFFERYHRELAGAPAVKKQIESAITNRFKRDDLIFKGNRTDTKQRGDCRSKREVHSRSYVGDVGLIFAHARSGSTALLQILQGMDKNLRAISEPFNIKEPLRSDPQLYERRVKIDEEQQYYQQFLVHLEDNYDLVKHLFTQTGFAQNEHLLIRPKFRTVFLTRRNLLQALVSVHLAMENNIWCQPFNENAVSLEERIKSHVYEPIDINWLNGRLMKHYHQIRSYKEVLRKGNREFYEIYYEDLFGLEISLEEKLARIGQICHFLAIEADFSKSEKAVVERYLDAGLRKINRRDTYLLIPNILEVEKRLGNSETGFLFEDSGDSYLQEFCAFD